MENDPFLSEKPDESQIKEQLLALFFRYDEIMKLKLHPLEDRQEKIINETRSNVVEMEKLEKEIEMLSGQITESSTDEQISKILERAKEITQNILDISTKNKILAEENLEITKSKSAIVDKELKETLEEIERIKQGELN